MNVSRQVYTLLPVLCCFCCCCYVADSFLFLLCVFDLSFNPKKKPTNYEPMDVHPMTHMTSLLIHETYVGANPIRTMPRWLARLGSAQLRHLAPSGTSTRSETTQLSTRSRILSRSVSQSRRQFEALPNCASKQARAYMQPRSHNRLLFLLSP